MRSSAEELWTPGPLRPLLSKGAVHVWRADLALLAGDLSGVLSAEESARAERLLSAEDRERWVRSRALLRTLLARYLGEDPRALRLLTGAHGKPALAGGPVTAARPSPTSSQGAGELSFNLSHSGGLALYAFAQAGAVGVDVEVLGRARPEVSLAARAFGPAQASRLKRMPAPMREREFLRAWTRREAELKCRGVGIGVGGEDSLERHALWIAELEMAPRALATVAAELPPRELRCWEWSAEPA